MTNCFDSYRLADYRMKMIDRTNHYCYTASLYKWLKGILKTISGSRYICDPSATCSLQMIYPSNYLPKIAVNFHAACLTSWDLQFSDLSMKSNTEKIMPDTHLQFKIVKLILDSKTEDALELLSSFYHISPPDIKVGTIKGRRKTEYAV